MELSRFSSNRFERGLRRFSTGSSNINQCCEQKDIHLDIFYSVCHHNSSNDYVGMPTSSSIARRSISDQKDNGISYAPPCPLPLSLDEERDEIRYDDLSISSLYDWRSDLLFKPKRPEDEVKVLSRILPSQDNRTITKITIEPSNDLPLDFAQSDKYTEFCCSWPSNRLNHHHETKLKDITITSALLPLVLTNVKQTSTNQQGPLTASERLHHLYSSSYPMGKKQLLENEQYGIVTNCSRNRNKESYSVRTRASTPPIHLRHVARPLKSMGKDTKPTPPIRQRSNANVIPFAMFPPRDSKNKDILGSKPCEMKVSGLHEKIPAKNGPTLGQFITDNVCYDMQGDEIKNEPFKENGEFDHSHNTPVIAKLPFSRWDSIEARSSPPRPYTRESKSVPANNILTALSSSDTMEGAGHQHIASERITSQFCMESDTTTGNRQHCSTNKLHYSFVSSDESRLNKRIHLEHSRTKRRNIPMLKDRFGNVKCTKSVTNNGLVLSPATRQLFIIPEETIDTAIHQSKRSCDSDETATFASCSTTNTPKLNFDNFQRQRRKRQRQMHKLAYLQHMQSTKSLGSSKLKDANDRAAVQRLLVAANTNVERKEYLVGYGQYIDALQLCDQQGLIRSDPIMIEIRSSLKSMIDHILLPSPFLCDTILAAIDNRADFESRRPNSIRYAIVTLKAALELRKAIMEKKLLSIGVASPANCDLEVLKQSNKYPEFEDGQQRQHALDPVIRRSARSLLILSRCFHEIGKHKCGQQAKKEANALFRTKRLHL